MTVLKAKDVCEKHEQLQAIKLSLFWQCVNPLLMNVKPKGVYTWKNVVNIFCVYSCVSDNLTPHQAIKPNTQGFAGKNAHLLHEVFFHNQHSKV